MKTKERKPLSWKPRRRGNVYCAPACGRGCTWEEYQQAVNAAANLAERTGIGYKPIVHENLGWYFKVVSRCGHIKVHQSKVDKSFTCYVSAEAHGAGGQWVGQGKTPRAAILNTILQVVRARQALDELLEKINPPHAAGKKW